MTAGIGSDHVDLQAAIDAGITVAEVTYSNSISVSEHVVMAILALVRNYIPSYQWVVEGGWNIADCVSRSYDLEGMQVGTVGAGRIGSAVMRRLKPFEVGLHYTDRHRLPEEVEDELGVTYHPDVESLVEVCDVVTINAPLHPETEHLFDAALIGRMKRGAYLVNTARGKICDRDAVVRGLRERASSPAMRATSGSRSRRRRDHPWRSMPHHGMTPHISGSSLSAQARYAAGAREILECWFDGRPIREEYLIVDARPARRSRRALLQRGRRDRRLRGGGAVQPLSRRASSGSSPSGADAVGARAGAGADDLGELGAVEAQRDAVVGREPGREAFARRAACRPAAARPRRRSAGRRCPGRKPSPSRIPSSCGPNESVTPASNQQIIPALQPASTMPASHASRRIASKPCTRQIASAFAVFPPET